MSAPAISVRQLHKKYGQNPVLNALDWEVQPGDIVALLGVNGAGKTTLIKSLLGFCGSEGDIKISGLDPRKAGPSLFEKIATVADVAVLPKWAKVGQLIDFCANMHPKFSKEKAEKFLSIGGISHAQQVKSLSKGMMAQLHLSLVMAIDAEILILDEPTLGLDILYRKKFYQQLIEDYYDEQKTIIICTHQIDEIEDLINRISIIHEGKMVINETVDAVEERFISVKPRPEHIDDVRSLNPIATQSIFGQPIFILDGADRNEMKKIGDVTTPSLSDLFVALVGKTYQ